MHGLEMSLWMMQYQYALDDEHPFQGDRKAPVTANWRRTKDIQVGDWFVAYLPKKKSPSGNTFFAVGQVRQPRKIAKPPSNVSTVEEYVKSQNSHQIASGVVRYSDSPAFYEDFDDHWHAAGSPEMKYAQRIDVDRWLHVVPDGVAWLPKLAIGPNEIQRAFFEIEEPHFHEISNTLQAAAKDSDGMFAKFNSISETPADLNTQVLAPGRKPRSWIFQANPKYFDLPNALKSIRILRWRANQFKDEIRSGDDVYMWLSGDDARIVAHGSVITDPQMMGDAPEELPFILEAEDPEQSLCVAIEIDTVFGDPVSRKDLKEHAVLSSISILRQPRGTNFALTDVEADALNELCPHATIKRVSLIEAFTYFRENPLESLRVRIRQLRAAQLRELLSDVENITLDAFNRELWMMESSTLLNGKEIKGKLFGSHSLDDDFIEKVSAAIQAGTLELHGNYVWRPASSIFKPQASGETDDEKLGHVRSALHILNDPSLSPIEKANRIGAVPGFGLATSTAMVMTYHPIDFLIWNKQSKEAFDKLDVETKDLDSFQASAMTLKERLGVNDFIELDWFLYLINQGEIEITDRDQRDKMLRDIEEAVLANLLVSSEVQTEKEQLVKSRIGQGAFRQNIQQFEKSCRVSGVDDARFLIASHIKPWAACNNHERLDGANGLFLSPNIDWLFDRGYITFHDDGTLVVASVVDKETLRKLGVNSDIKHCGSFSPGQRQYLAYHRTKIFLCS